VGDQLSPQIVYEGVNILAFVGGIILLVSISLGMSMTFRHLNIQLKLTNLYDNFIANITHELKSPLSSIQLYLETLLTRDVPVAKQKEFYEMMIKDAGRLKNLINSILEISALEQKKVTHNYHVYKMDELINGIIKESKEQFNLSDNTLTVEGYADCKCVVDRAALKIVLNNLMDNAIKYSTKKPSIKIRMTSDQKSFIIEFEDEGIGIPIKEQKKVFSKFHRIYDKDIPNVKGTGLGLYWVKEIIKNFGGRISLLSKGKYKGTTFRIELPIYESSKKRYINKLLKLTKRETIQMESNNE
jgi:signal transduction histidine kinase